MFVIKYHKDGIQDKYYSEKRGRVTTLKAATAFGEDLREKFAAGCKGTMTLKTIKVSDVAEMMYRNTFCRVADIKW